MTLSPLRFVLSVYFFIFVGNNQERNTCMKSTKEYIELLKEFKNKEAGHYAISRIGIFGSVARGEQRVSPNGIVSSWKLEKYFGTIVRMPG